MRKSGCRVPVTVLRRLPGCGPSSFRTRGGPRPKLEGLNPEKTAARQQGQGLNRRILALAIPAFGALIAEPLFLAADSAIVGHLGVAELAGMGLAATVVQTVV